MSFKAWWNSRSNWVKGGLASILFFIVHMVLEFRIAWINGGADGFLVGLPWFPNLIVFILLFIVGSLMGIFIFRKSFASWINGLMWGALVGLFIYARDFDYFLNVGGPNTIISDEIIQLFGANIASFHVKVFLPLIVLLLFFGIVGMILGYIISLIAEKFRSRK